MLEHLYIYIYIYIYIMYWYRFTNIKCLEQSFQMVVLCSYLARYRTRKHVWTDFLCNYCTLEFKFAKVRLYDIHKIEGHINLTICISLKFSFSIMIIFLNLFLLDIFISRIISLMKLVSSNFQLQNEPDRFSEIIMLKCLKFFCYAKQ